MPFDNAPERAPSEELSLYERLKILRELVPKSGNQGSWSTCLWSLARRDKRLRAAGLAQYDLATGMGPRPGVNDFFGGHYFWGAASMAAHAESFSSIPAITQAAALKPLTPKQHKRTAHF